MVSASRYVHCPHYIVHNIIIKSKQEMAINKNIFQLYQKTCSVCQCAITKDCVEGNGKFYHSNCIKVITDYRAESCVTFGSNPLYLQCVDCKMVLDGCYYVFMGNFFCEKDYNVSCGCQLQIAKCLLSIKPLFRTRRRSALTAASRLTACTTLTPTTAPCVTRTTRYTPEIVKVQGQHTFVVIFIT